MTTATQILQSIADAWLDGSPADKSEIELAKLRAKAAELGMRLVEDEPERDEPVIYERGELAPADTRTEHDKSL